MTYSVKETYYTLQGEGAQTGRPAVFLRFAGCNLWISVIPNSLAPTARAVEDLQRRQTLPPP
jgi:hypothetical protein